MARMRGAWGNFRSNSRQSSRIVGGTNPNARGYLGPGGSRLTPQQATELRNTPLWDRFSAQARQQITAAGGVPTPAPAPAPAASAAPAAPQSNPFIPDSQFDGEVTNLKQRRDNALAGIQNQENAVRQEFGIEDASNPFSRAKLLEEAYARNQRATTNSMASRGQLYAGSTQNARNAVDRDNLQSKDALDRSYKAALQQLAAQRWEANQAFTEGEAGARGSALGRMISTRPDPMEQPLPGEPVGDTGAVAGKDGKPTTPQAAKPGTKPKAGFKFVQDAGPRKGQSFNVVMKNGKRYRRYQDGTTVLAL